MSGAATRRALDFLARPLRRWSRVAWLAATAGVLALVLGSVAWLARLGWLTAPWWVLAAWAAAALALAVLGRLAWAGETQLGLVRIARGLEERGSWRRGTITAMLDSAAPGTSDALFDAADRARAVDVEERGLSAVAPLRNRIFTRAAGSMACLALGVAALGSAGPFNGAAAALWRPRRAWEATVAPVNLTASAPVIDRGGSVGLTVRAIGRKNATLWLRAPGERWRPRAVALDSLGIATVPIGPIESDLFARATSGSKSSDTVMVRVRLPVFLGALTVTARYPAYLRLEDEPMPTGGDTLLLPAGTRLDTKGEVTAPLESARWVAEGVKAAAGASAELGVDAGRFSGSFTPRASGQYRLALSVAGGAPLVGDTLRLPIRVLPDRAPLIEIPVPGADTTAPVNLQLSLVIDVRDDHGVTEVLIESRRISRLGVADSALRETVDIPPGRPDRAILNFNLDLDRRGLLPGDTIRYLARAADNTPTRQRSRSREYVLRLPTMSEIRAAQRRSAAEIATQLDSVTAKSERLERQTQDLSQAHSRAGSTSDSRGSDALPFEEAEKAEAVARAEQALIEEAESLSRALDELRQSAETAGITDSVWQQQLAEIRAQLERALSPELRERLAELQDALQDLSTERTREALERLAEAQKELREALQRSRELFRRAALEGDLANLSQESRDLRREQEQWNERVPLADSAPAATAERQLAERADSLAAAVGRVGKELAEGGAPNELETARQQAGKAAQQMKQAERSASGGQRQRARQQGEQAADALEPVSGELEKARESMAREWREEVMQALDQALAETSRLTERQLAVGQAFRAGSPAADARGEQAAIEEGVEKLLDQLRAAAGKNALVSGQIGVALAAARQQMRSAREAVASAIPNPREAADEAGGAVDAMNAAAYQMLRSRGEVSGSASGSGLAEALEQMAELAQQQGSIGRQAGGLLPMAGGAVQQRLRQLALEQRALAERLERMRAEGQIGGTGEMADEAKELARRLESGRLDRQTVERQERLFRRMLDAGRTLQGRERDEKKERESVTAAGDSVRLPPAMRAKLLDEHNRLRVPTWEELQQLSPEERRLVVEYFRRLSDAPVR